MSKRRSCQTSTEPRCPTCAHVRGARYHYIPDAPAALTSCPLGCFLLVDAFVLASVCGRISPVIIQCSTSELLTCINGRRALSAVGLTLQVVNGSA